MKNPEKAAVSVLKTASNLDHATLFFVRENPWAKTLSYLRNKSAHFKTR
jgi:hypothetical protein